MRLAVGASGSFAGGSTGAGSGRGGGIGGGAGRGSSFTRMWSVSLMDPGTAARVMDVLVSRSREHGASLVLVTHSEAAATRADRVLLLTSEGVRVRT